jgi:hypothetical protein
MHERTNANLIKYLLVLVSGVSILFAPEHDADVSHMNMLGVLLPQTGEVTADTCPAALVLHP